MMSFSTGNEGCSIKNLLEKPYRVVLTLIVFIIIVWVVFKVVEEEATQ